MVSKDENNRIKLADIQRIELSALSYLESPNNSDPLELGIGLDKSVAITVRRLSEESNGSKSESGRGPVVSYNNLPSATETFSIPSIKSSLEAAKFRRNQNLFTNRSLFEGPSKRANETLFDPFAQCLESVAPDDCSGGTTPRTSPKWEDEPVISIDGASSLSGGRARTPRLSPIPFTGSPLAMTRSASLANSARSFRSNDDLGDEWNSEKLLELTESIRESLRHSSLPQNDAGDLSELLDIMFLDEGSRSRAVSLSVISHSRLDKALAEIKIAYNMGLIPEAEQFKQMVERIHALEQSWQQRFKGLWSKIDSMREQDMKQTGYLRDVALESGDCKGGSIWVVKNSQASKVDQEERSGFAPGDWWLNIHCALRDGAVGTTDKLVSIGMYGVTCLAMLTGEEVDGPTRGMYEFSLQGSWSDMLWSLMCHRHPIRIVRGSKLKSKYAPKAGIRYDGLYYIRQFGHKLLNDEKKIYQCTLILERVDGQVSLAEVLKFPRPSQLDDWVLYEGIICDHYRACEGDEAYDEWRQFEEEEEEDKIQWLKARALEDGFQRYNLVPRKASYLQKQVNEEWVYEI